MAKVDAILFVIRVWSRIDLALLYLGWLIEEGTDIMRIRRQPEVEENTVEEE